MAPRAKAAVKVESLQATLITPPDVAAIQSQMAALGDLYQVTININSDDSAFEASAFGNKLQTYIKWVEGQFAQPTKLAYDLHRSLTSLRGALISRPTEVVEQIKRGCVAWDDKKRAIAEAKRQEEIKRRAIEQAARDAEAKRLAEEAEAEKAPWETWDEPAHRQVPVAVAAVIPAAPVYVPAEAVSTPVVGHFRNSPYRAKVDIKDLVIACAERLKNGDETLLPYLLVNESLLNSKAREVGPEISVVLDPCITAVRGRGMAI